MDASYDNDSSVTHLGCDASQLGPVRDDLYLVIPVTLIYVIIFITGCVGNISTCIVIYKNRSMHTATNYYLFNLAVSDLLLLISGLPQEMYLIWRRYPYVFGSTFCFLRGLLAETSGNATVLTITGFTVERYLAICHPFLSHTMSKLSRAVKFIMFIWLLAICLAIPQALPLKVVDVHGCQWCMPVDIILENAFELSTFLFFVAPMTLITVLYVLIGLRLKSSSMMKTRSANARLQSKSSRKVIKMLVAVVVTFFICWAPFHVQRLFYIYSESVRDEETSLLHKKIYEVVTYISGVLYYASATTNPILYNIMSIKFRDAFRETFTGCCCFTRMQNGTTERYYSVLSRSNQRAQDSTDSGKDEPSGQTNTTLTHKNSVESCHASTKNKTKRTRPSSIRRDNYRSDISTEKSRQLQRTLTPNSSPTYLTLPVTSQLSTSKFQRVKELFECFSRKSFEEGKRLSPYYSSSPRELREHSIILELQTKERLSLCRDRSSKDVNGCDISNSSLKDIESGAIEDELTAYMKDLKARELKNEE